MVLGHYEIVGRYVGSKFKKTLKGMLVDSTSFFLNPEVQDALREVVVKPFIRDAARDAQQHASLDKVYYKNIKALEQTIQSGGKMDLRHILRVYALRSGVKKYLIMQWGRIEKTLAEYAVKDMESKFTLSFGPQPQGTVTGRIYEAQNPLRTPIGRTRAILLVPDDPESPSSQIADMPEEIKNLLYLVPQLPAVTEFKELIRSKEEEARRFKIQSEELAKQNAQLQARVNALEIALFGSGERKEAAGKPDLADLATLALPSIVGYYVADALGVMPIIGVLLGALAGFLIMKRR